MLSKNDDSSIANARSGINAPKSSAGNFRKSYAKSDAIRGFARVPRAIFGTILNIRQAQNA
jgi:hypothetical protein